MAVTVSRSGAMPQCCSMPDRISHNIQRGRQLAAALGGLWRSGSLANYYWLQFKSRSKKRGGSKRIKRIRAPSASFRGSTRCDQHGPLSCERAGLRLVFPPTRPVFRSQTALELLSAPSEMPTDRLCTPFTAVQHEDDILGSVTTNLWICASEHVLWWCRDVSVGVNDGTDRLLPY